VPYIAQRQYDPEPPNVPLDPSADDRALIQLLRRRLAPLCAIMAKLDSSARLGSNCHRR
jgi:hypothetical protein